jgi:RHS repeat-associated protein
VTKVVDGDGQHVPEAERLRQYYYHADHLGSAQLITDYKGEAYERIEYTPYGELWIERAVEASVLDVTYRFTGKERDAETGLYYYGARYLDSRASRWISGDPALGEYIPEAPINNKARKRNQNLPGMGGVFNTINLHIYHYAANNPLKYTDTDGKVIMIRGSTVEKAVDYLYKNSDTFRSSLNTLLERKNSLGQRLVVIFIESEAPYPGYMRTDTGVAERTVSTFTIDANGEIQNGSIEEGEEVQQVEITIDMNKIRERNLNILEVVAEEVMHAVDAASIGSVEFNKLVEEEQRTLKYLERPLENSAKERTQTVLSELP